MAVTHLQGDCREVLRTLPERSVHCCVTSPPYFGLRDYGCDGQLGMEKTPEEYVANMVEVFREVRRVLRDDGTLWLNIGDSYCNTDKWGGGGGNTGKQTIEWTHADPTCKHVAEYDPDSSFASTCVRCTLCGGSGHVPSWNVRSKKQQIKGLKPKDLVGVPWMLAFALRADGWYLRQDIIWHKPNPMPESVTDRCTKSHEYIFLMSKSGRYYFDQQAIAEDAKFPDGSWGRSKAYDGDESGMLKSFYGDGRQWPGGETRNKRSVWTVSTKPYKAAHFAVFPPDLIEPCILAGTSDEGCCDQCGAPFVRITENERVATRPAKDTKTTGDSMVDGNRDPERHVTRKTTKGWQQSCKCEGAKPVPCTVLDPFGGSGTTGQVAQACGCHAILIELNPSYIEMQKKRVEQTSLLV